jgi:uncharacterized protein
MRWERSELLENSGSVTFDEDVEIDRSAFDKNKRINGAENVHIDGSGWLDDENDRFFVKLHVTGDMLVPDSITNEEISVPFETESDEVYSFVQTDEDGARIVTDEVIDLLQAVVDDILLEVPLEVTHAAEEDYPEGDGWKVYSEAAYERSRKDHLDPRLAKLRDFKNEQ